MTAMQVCAVGDTYETGTWMRYGPTSYFWAGKSHEEVEHLVKLNNFYARLHYLGPGDKAFAERLMALAEADGLI